MYGFFYLILSIVFSSAVALIMKVANQQEVRLGQFLAVNYLVCTVSVLAWGGWKTAGSSTPFVFALSAFIGIMFVVSLWLFHRAIAVEGLALSTTLMRLSAALPTLGSLLLFSEQADSTTVLGITLAFLSLPLSSREPVRLNKLGDNLLQGMIWGLLLFAAYGLTDFSFKIQAELAPAADSKAFMTGIFGTSLLLTLPHLFRGEKPDQKTLTLGSLLGAANMLSTYVWIQALAAIPGSLAYPTLGLGVIAVTTLFSLALWQERLRPANYLFLALASAAVLLLHI